MGLVLQPQFGMFGALSLVVALAGAGLVVASPGGPVVGVGVGVSWVGQDGPESSDFVAGQWDQSGYGPPFCFRSLRAVMVRNAAASMDRVICRYQATYFRIW